MSSWYAVERTSYRTLLFIFIWGMDAWNRTARIGEPSSMNMTFSCSKSTIVWYNSVFASKTIEILHISANLSDRNFLNPSRAYLYLFLFFFLSNIGFYHRIKFIITLLSLRSEIFYLFFFSRCRVYRVSYFMLLTVGSVRMTLVAAGRVLPWKAVWDPMSVLVINSHWEKSPAPGGPGGPVAPWSPSDPGDPCDPLKPCWPITPWGPCVPLTPWGPAGPTNPWEPLKPRGPTGPWSLLTFSTWKKHKNLIP